MRGIKQTIDKLGLINTVSSVDDVTLYLLDGLGAGYRKISSSIRAHENSIAFAELHDMLVAQESYLKRLEASFAALVATTNNATT